MSLHAMRQCEIEIESASHRMERDFHEMAAGLSITVCDGLRQCLAARSIWTACQRISSGGYLPCNKNTKKIVFGVLLELQKREVWVTITHNNRLVIQLFLSSEIGPFEDRQPQILTKKLTLPGDAHKYKS